MRHSLRSLSGCSLCCRRCCETNEYFLGLSSFCPLHPCGDIPLELEQLQHIAMPVQPHVLLLSSRFPAFAKVRLSFFRIALTLVWLNHALAAP